MTHSAMAQASPPIPCSTRAGPNKRGYMGFVKGPFDYGSLATNLADEARASAQRINASKQNHIIDVGRELMKMKAKLAHGHFTDWIDRELNFSTTTARNYMRAAKEFADKPTTVAVLPPATLYRLAGAEPQIRNEIVGRVEAGEYLDREEVDETIRQPQREKEEAKKLASGQAAKEASAQRRRERRERNWRAEFEAEQKERLERQQAAARKLVRHLAPHFTKIEIYEISELCREAGSVALSAALADAEVPS